MDICDQIRHERWPATQGTWDITLLPLPPKSPSSTHGENISQVFAQKFLSNRVFASYAAILDGCLHAWCSLTAEAGRIASTGTRDWAIWAILHQHL
jgi:hypothetical protein